MKDKRIKKELWVQTYQIALDRSMGNFGMDLCSDNPAKAHEALCEVQRQAKCFAFAAIQEYEKVFG